MRPGGSEDPDAAKLHVVRFLGDVHVLTKQQFSTTCQETADIGGRTAAHREDLHKWHATSTASVSLKVIICSSCSVFLSCWIIGLSVFCFVRVECQGKKRGQLTWNRNADGRLMLHRLQALRAEHNVAVSWVARVHCLVARLMMYRLAVLSVEYVVADHANTPQQRGGNTLECACKGFAVPCLPTHVQSASCGVGVTLGPDRCRHTVQDNMVCGHVQARTGERGRRRTTPRRSTVLKRRWGANRRPASQAPCLTKKPTTQHMSDDDDTH